MTYYLTVYRPLVLPTGQFVLHRKPFKTIAAALAYVTTYLVEAEADELVFQTTWRAGKPARLKIELSPTWGPAARVDDITTLFIDRADVTAEIDAARAAAGNQQIPAIVDLPV